MPSLRYFIFILIAHSGGMANGQMTIPLTNPSFEGKAHKGVPGYSIGIDGWKDCGSIYFPNSSPPDLLPLVDPKKGWGVDNIPKEGSTYISMVVREDNSWEFVSQKLKTPLQAHQCYTLSVYLSLSDTYNSATAQSQSRVNNPSGPLLEDFSNPVMLVIWGGNDDCDRKEILAESQPIDHHDWKGFSFNFKPIDSYSYIVLEAYYVKSAPSLYNGHILIDDLSDIALITCE